MSDAVELATAYISLVPSAKGIGASIAKELSGVEGAAAAAGTKSGAALKSGMSGQLASLAKSSVPLLGIGAAAVSSAVSVESAQNTIIRATGATGAAQAGLLKSFENVGKKSAAPLGTIASTLAEVYQRTGLTGGGLESLTRQVVTFNRITKDSPVNVQELTKSLSGFNVPAKGMSGELDRLFKISQKTGVPLSDLVSTLGTAGPTLRQFKLPVDQSASLLAKLDKAGVDSSATIGGLRHAFTTFAKAGEDPKKALIGVLGQIDALVKSGNTAGAQQLGVKIFGARGVGIVDAAIKGKLAIGDLTKTVATTGPGIVDTAGKTSNLAGKMAILKNNAQLALAKLGGPGLSVATQLMTLLLPPLTSVLSAFSSLPGPVQSSLVALAAVGAVGGKVTKTVKPLVDIGKAGIATAKAVGSLGSKLASAGSSALGYAKAIGRGASAAASFAKDAVSSALAVGKQVAAFVAQKAAALAAAVAQKTMAAAQWLLNAAMDANPITLIVIAIAALAAGVFIAYKHFGPFREVVQAVGRAALAAGKFIANGLGSAFSWIKTHWPLLLAILTGPIGIAVLLITRNWNKIKAGFIAVRDAIGTAAGVVVRFVTGIPGRIAGVAATMWNGIKRSLAGAVSWIGSKVSAVVGFVTGLPARISRSASGMFDGIKSAFLGVVNFVIRIWNDTIGSFSFHAPKWVPGLGGKGFDGPKISPVKLASGALVKSTTLALLGETHAARPELVSPIPTLEQVFRRELDRNPARPPLHALRNVEAGGGVVAATRTQNIDAHIELHTHGGEIPTMTDIELVSQRQAYRLRALAGRA